MDVAALIARFASGTYTVHRRAAAVYVHGRAQAGVDSTIQIVASVQPVTGNDLLRLPEGRRSVETRVLFTATELRAGGQGKDHEADHVEMDGERWEVQLAEKWPAFTTTDPGYWRCVVQAVR